MTTMQIDRAVVEQALHVAESAGYPVALIKALRDALAQQNDPTDPGNDVDVLREHVRHLERRIRELHAQQAEPQGCATEEDCTKQPWCRIRGECQRKQAEPLNLRDPAVQKRFAAQWGYVPAAAQAEPVEPVEPVAWRWGYRSVTTGEMDWRGYVEIAAHPNLRSPEIIIEPLYTAPPQRKPLTLEEIYHATGHCGVSKYTAVNITRAVERAHGIKE